MKTQISREQRQRETLDAFARALPRIRATGAQVQRIHAGYYLVRHRGAVIELWPTGKWRPRMVSVHRHVTRTDGIDALIALLTGEIPEWMLRRRVGIVSKTLASEGAQE